MQSSARDELIAPMADVRFEKHGLLCKPPLYRLLEASTSGRYKRGSNAWRASCEHGSDGRSETDGVQILKLVRVATETHSDTTCSSIVALAMRVSTMRLLPAKAVSYAMPMTEQTHRSSTHTCPSAGRNAFAYESISGAGMVGEQSEQIIQRDMPGVGNVEGRLRKKTHRLNGSHE